MICKVFFGFLFVAGCATTSQFPVGRPVKTRAVKIAAAEAKCMSVVTGALANETFVHGLNMYYDIIRGQNLKLTTDVAYSVIRCKTAHNAHHRAWATADRIVRENPDNVYAKFLRLKLFVAQYRWLGMHPWKTGKVRLLALAKKYPGQYPELKNEIAVNIAIGLRKSFIRAEAIQAREDSIISLKNHKVLERFYGYGNFAACDARCAHYRKLGYKRVAWAFEQEFPGGKWDVCEILGIPPGKKSKK